MGNKIIFKVMLFSKTLIVLCIINSSSQQVIKNLGLNEGDMCREDPDMIFRCTYARDCPTVKESIITRNYLDICGFVGLEPIVCCPAKAIKPLIEIPESKNKNSTPTKEIPIDYGYGTDEQLTIKNGNARIADKKCSQYYKLVKYRFAPALFGGTAAKYKEFPHMALIGYGNTTEYEDDWRCGGSLISERWILTAAHCQQSSGNMARWARLGVIDRFVNKASIVQPKDYRIVQHVIHPDYKPPSLYNDIALFRLEKDVEFSDAVRPICLNSDPSLTPLKQILTGWGRISTVISCYYNLSQHRSVCYILKQIATGWGRTATAGPLSDNLLKVDLDIYPIKQCNESYFSNNNTKLQFGILHDSMICAGSFNGEKDSCSGDSGGPLQLDHINYFKMYTQYGITSFGKFCGDKDTPGIYTRVAKYISWIEEIAFSNAN